MYLDKAIEINPNESCFYICRSLCLSETAQNEKSLSELIFKFLKSDTSFKKKTLLAQSAIRKFSLKECVRGYEKIFDKI